MLKVPKTDLYSYVAMSVMNWKPFLFLLFVFMPVWCRVERPRGVALTRASLYDPSSDFTCLNGQRTIPFSQVNDDYCDCEDGSDEPGTSACPHGSFHCTNSGFKPLNIPSSRVNDGICDCCDGSDEWKNEGLCPDHCKDLWKATREDMLKQAEAAKKGYEIRLQYVTRGMALRAEEEGKLDTLLKEVEILKELEEKFKLEKEEAEKAESDAKSIEQLAWDDFKAKIQAHQETRQAADAFTELDVNKDGSISIEEMKIHLELDSNPDDGEFTDDEIRTILDGDTADAPHFIEVVWTNIGSRYVKQVVAEPPEPKQDSDNDQEEEEYDEDDEDEDFREDDDEDDERLDGEYEEDLDEDADRDVDQEEGQESIEREHEIAEAPEETPPASSLPNEPVWNELTQTFIRAADVAREEYKENERKKTDMEREISSLRKTLEMDFGPDQSYHELKGQCFNFDTHEYTYKLCPFDKAVQVPKNGGSETNMGRWGSWNGGDANKYSSMKYTNGLKCWNGPDRSTEVKIGCGDENKLLSASEPSRCEYRFEFQTPAACEPIHVPDSPHDEL